MTVSSQVSRIEYSTTNGLLTYAYPFRIYADADLDVYLAGTQLTLNVGYTVTGAGNPGGGNVVLAVNPGAGALLVIERVLEITQGHDYVENDAFPAESHETALDYRTMIEQHLYELIRKAPKFVRSTTTKDKAFPEPVAGGFIQWDNNASLLTTLVPPVDSFEVGSLTEYLRANLPGGATSGAIARVTNEVRGIWVHNGQGWHPENRSIINVREHGAILDGSLHPLSERFATLAGAQLVYPHAVSLADQIDWAAIQSALTAANSIHAAAVDLTTGQGWINRRLSVSDDTIVFSSGHAILKKTDDFGDLGMFRNNIMPTNDGERPKDIHFRAFEIDGNSSNDTATQFGHGIELYGGVRCSAEGLYIHHCKGDGLYIGPPSGFTTVLPEDVTYQKNLIEDCYRNGISVTGGSRICTDFNTLARCGLWAIDWEPDGSSTPNIGDSTLRGNLATDCGGEVDWAGIGGAYGLTTALGSIRNAIMTDNFATDTTGAFCLYRGIVGFTCERNVSIVSSGFGIAQIAGAATAPSQTRIRDNFIYQPTLQGIVYFDAAPAEIDENWVLSGGAQGIQVDLMTNGLLRKNYVFDSDDEGFLLQGLRGGLVALNHAIGNGSHGIRLISTGGTHPTKNLVACNYAANNTGAGIREDASADSNHLVGNYLDGNSGGAIVVVGANTIVDDNFGFPTKKNLLSTTFAIDGTGVKTVTTAHGLAWTPTLSMCQVAVLEETNVDDWAYNLLKVESVDATNVVCKINVSTASLTVGATARLAIRIARH